MSLDGVRWECFRLSDIFDIKQTANGIDKIKLTQGAGEYPYVTRSDMNNGINMFVCFQESYSLNSGNCISVGLDTQTVFYQPTEFYTGQNIQILRNDKLNQYNAKFMLPLLKHTLSIFSWGGNGATLTRLRRSKIFLPVNDEGLPDWQFMESYMRQREQAMIDEYVNYALGKYPPPPPVNYLVFTCVNGGRFIFGIYSQFYLVSVFARKI